MSHLREVTAFAREVLKAEFMTPAGVVNLVWQACVLAVILLLGFADVVQAIVRTWNGTYSSGLPSVIWVLVAWGGLMLACVTILALVGRRR